MNGKAIIHKMKKRLFLAIPLSDSLSRKFSALGDNFDHLHGVRWTAKRNLHLTVCFFGDIEEKDIPTLSGEIGRIIAATPEFSLKFEEIIFAPPFRPPSMIWAEFEKNKEYSNLVQKIYTAVQGFMMEENLQGIHGESIPHITLARFAGPAVAATLKITPLEVEDMQVQECRLMESELMPAGPIYTVLKSYRLT